VGVVRSRGGGETSQAVAAVDQLFDCEEQDLILSEKVRGTGRRLRLRPMPTGS
jgi:hypothetical protein